MFNLFATKKKVKPLEITDSNFNDLVFNAKEPLILDFHATWCQPCHVMVSLMNRLAKEQDIQSAVKLGLIDINANPGLTQHFEIKSVPTLLFIHENKIYERHNGLIPYPILKQKILDFASQISQ